MIKLNKLVTESISGVNVLVSYDDPSQTFKVISKEKGDLLIEGDEIHVCTFLEVNGARIFAPRFMANYPLEKVNANNADMSHMSPFSLLEFLRLRKGIDGELELTIYPRDMQEGIKFLPGIKIPLGECLLEDMKKSSLINLMLVMKESTHLLKKVVVRTFKESDDRQIAFATEDGKYFPMIISPKDEDSFANSVVLVFGNSGIELDLDSLKTALKTPQTMSVISRDPNEVQEIDTIQECFSVDDLIDSHIVVFESTDLNDLSNTMFHVHPEATARNWKVSEIKEDVNKGLFYFEIQGDKTDEILKDDFVMGRLLSENVYITHRTPLHESTPMDKAVFALMNGMDINKVVKNMVAEQIQLNKTEKLFKECDCAGIGGLDVVAAVTPAAPVSDGCLDASRCVFTAGMTSKDIHGIEGKVLAPMKKQPKKKEKDVIKVNDDLRATILREMGIEDQYNKVMGLNKDLKEDGEDVGIEGLDNDSSVTDSFNLDSALSNDVGDSLGDTLVSDESNSDSVSSDKDSDENKIDYEVGVVGETVEGEPMKVEINYIDGSTSEEPYTNLVVASSVKPDEDEIM